MQEANKVVLRYAKQCATQSVCVCVSVCVCACIHWLSPLLWWHNALPITEVSQWSLVYWTWGQRWLWTSKHFHVIHINLDIKWHQSWYQWPQSNSFWTTVGSIKTLLHKTKSNASKWQSIKCGINVSCSRLKKTNKKQLNTKNKYKHNRKTAIKQNKTIEHKKTTIIEQKAIKQNKNNRIQTKNQ